MSICGGIDCWSSLYFFLIGFQTYGEEADSVNAIGLLSFIVCHDHLTASALAGIFLSHTAHAASVIVLYHMSKDVFRSLLAKSPSSVLEAETLALLASLLHILSPAGIFLSAPYGEALFSFLHFCGLWSYVRGYSHGERGEWKARNQLMVVAGALIGTATTVRSNGILGGILFAHDAVEEGYDFLALVISNGFREVTEIQRRMSRLGSTVFAGFLIGLGLAIPQVLAWREYCRGGRIDEKREWCSRLVPSIYAWVQDHYW